MPHTENAVLRQQVTELQMKNAQLENEIETCRKLNGQLREGLQRFTIFPTPYIEASHAGLYPAVAHAQSLLREDNTHTNTHLQNTLS